MPISIDPFFVHIFWAEEEEERHEEAEERAGLEGFRVSGLKYERKLEIGDLELVVDEHSHRTHESKRDLRDLLWNIVEELEDRRRK